MPIKINDKTYLSSLIELTKKSMITGDFDPVYPMLEVLTDGMSKEESIWYAFCYVGHYNLASGALCFHHNPKQVRKFKRRYPLRFQRRNLYPKDEYEQHWDSMWEIKKRYGSLSDWLEEGMTGDGEEDFLYLREKVLEIRGNGRWAGMKLGEVLKYSTYPHVEPCDMGHRYSAAPRKGLGLFYSDPGGNGLDVIEYLNLCGEHLTLEVIKHLPDLPYDFGVAEMETNLCDFKSMKSGKFYSGKCADVVLLTMVESKAPDKVLEPLYRAREDLFDHRVLGEYSGWDGVDPRRDKLFVEKGIIPWRWEPMENFQ